MWPTKKYEIGKIKLTRFIQSKSSNKTIIGTISGFKLKINREFYIDFNIKKYLLISWQVLQFQLISFKF